MQLSIITINFNDIIGLKKTMSSVFDQTYADIEYIVIDGGSTDGSAEYIKEHSEKLGYSISEPDDGIYDAMNKGINKASGDYLLFLNSGDWLVNNSVIESFIGFNPIEDIVYGDPLVRDGKSWKKKKMPEQMSIAVALTYTLSHQAEFYNRRLFEDNYRYDTSYKVISDWVLTNDAIIFKNCSTRYIDLLVCYFEDPGISGDFNRRHLERNRYLKDNFDQLFIDLLRDYQRLKLKHESLKGRSLVRITLWVIRKKAQLLKYFKK